MMFLFSVFLIGIGLGNTFGSAATMRIFAALALMPIATYCSTATTATFLVGNAIKEGLQNIDNAGSGMIRELVEEVTSDLDGVAKPFIQRNARLFGEAAKLKSGKDITEEALKVRYYDD